MLCQRRIRREGGLEWTKRSPKIQAHGQHMPEANVIQQSCLVEKGDLHDSKHRTVLSNSCCHPRGLELSRMLWREHHGQSPALWRWAGSLQALKHLYMPMFLQINPSVSPWRHNRTLLIQTEAHKQDCYSQNYSTFLGVLYPWGDISHSCTTK